MLVTVANTWKQSKYASTGEKVDIVWYSHTIEYDTAVKVMNCWNTVACMNLGNISLKGKSQIIIYIMTFFIKLKIFFKDSK